MISEEDEMLSECATLVEIKHLEDVIAQLTQDRELVDQHFRPSPVIMSDIASAEVELAKKKVEIEDMREHEKRSSQDKYDERVVIANAALSNALKDMQVEVLITDNKCSAMLRKIDLEYERKVSTLKREYDVTLGRELQPGTPENTRKLLNFHKDEEILAKKSLKRKLSFKPASNSVDMSVPDNI